MKSRLLISSILLVLSGLILSACGTSVAQSNATADGPETEYCIDSKTGAKMSYQEADGIALNSECIDRGQLKESHFCNSDTGTWWIELEIERPGCAPACVVDVNAKAAETNWRCTGLIPQAETGETVEIPESVQAARDSALDYLSDSVCDQVLVPGLDWTAENVTPGWTEKPVPGWSVYRFTSESLVLTIGHAVLPPEQTVYQVTVEDVASGFRWDGEVDANGKVKELSVSPVPAGETVVAWYGSIESLTEGAQFDDFLTVLPEGAAEVGVEGANDDLRARIRSLRGSATHAHFWGTLTCPAIDYGGCQLVVARLRPDGLAPLPEADPVNGWEGVLYSGPPGPRSGGDDYFVLTGDWNVPYGVNAIDQTVQSQLESLRDTGTAVRLWGELVAGIPDWNGTQIQVNRIEIVNEPSGTIPPAPVWPETDEGLMTFANETFGYQLQVPPTATIAQLGAVALPPDELTVGITEEELMAQLQQRYGDQLCVHIEYGLGYVYISAPVNDGFRYSPCGRTGVGAGAVSPKSEDIAIDSRIYAAKGFEFVGDVTPCGPAADTLDCHNETLVIVLDDGTRIEYGARPDPTGTYEDYLMKGKEAVRYIVESFQHFALE
jgi:hypothetical protein